MLTLKNTTENQIKKILSLFDEYSRVEVALRLGICPASMFPSEAHHMVEIMDKLREEAYGTSSLVELGEIFGMAVKTGENTGRVIRKKKVKSKVVRASEVATSHMMQTTKKKKKKIKKKKINMEGGIDTPSCGELDDALNSILGG